MEEGDAGRSEHGDCVIQTGAEGTRGGAGKTWVLYILSLGGIRGCSLVTSDKLLGAQRSQEWNA